VLHGRASTQCDACQAVRQPWPGPLERKKPVSEMMIIGIIHSAHTKTPRLIIPRARPVQVGETLTFALCGWSRRVSVRSRCPRFTPELHDQLFFWSCFFSWPRTFFRFSRLLDILCLFLRSIILVPRAQSPGFLTRESFRRA